MTVNTLRAAIGAAIAAPIRVLALLLIVCAAAEPARAQSQGTDSQPSTTAEAEGADPEVQEAEDDEGMSKVEPDFTIVNLPTTLRLPKFGSAFRVTHRFTRPLNDGSFGNLVEDFFGFDGGAQIGLEYRFGIWDGAQIGIYRTSDRTIQFFGQYGLLRQREGRPVSVDAWLAIDGTNNFRDSYSPVVGAVISHTFDEVAAVYVQPAWVDNTNTLPSELVEDNSSFVIGFGGRLRVRPTVYVSADVAPAVAGHDPGDPVIAFGLEKRVGGHSFQVNFSNSVGTTLAQQIRRGGGTDDWYIGFNISRKFY